MTLNEIRELIELVADKGFAEFQMEHSGFKLKILANAPGGGASTAPERTIAQPAEAPAWSAPLPPPVVEVGPAPASEEVHVVTSPIVGTFYRAPSPTAEAFVKIGDHVEQGAVLCIVEAMKLMNEIEADAAGEIVKVFVENGRPVEYGQPLFGIRPV